MKRMLSMFALLGAFLLLPLVAKGQEDYLITFEQVEHCTISAKYFNAGEYVTVSSGDRVSKYKSLQILATPEEGYEVANYIINGVERENPGNGIREMVKEDLTISARVAPVRPCGVTIIQPEHGTLAVTCDGAVVNSGDQVDSGKTLRLKLTPDEGYDIDSWLVDGKRTKPYESETIHFTYSVVVKNDISVSALLKELGTQTLVPVTIVQPENGTIEVHKGTNKFGELLTSGAEVEAGSEITMVITPDANYVLDYWLVNGQRVDKQASFLSAQKTIEVLEATTVSAVLKESGYIVTYSQPEHGTLEVTTRVNGEEITIPSGSRVKERTYLTIEATVEKGYIFKHFLVNGEIKESSSSAFYYVMLRAEADMTIEAVIEKAQPCIVTLEPFEHGTLTAQYGSYASPIVVASGDEVPSGTSLTIRAEVDPAYEFKHFLVNGEEKQSSSSYSNTLYYTVTGSVTIAVVAEKKPVTTVTIDPFEHGEIEVTYGPYSNVITVSSGDEVPIGEMLDVYVTIDDGYELEHFLVNGEAKPDNSGYIKVAVTGPLTLSAVAKEKVAPQPTEGTIIMVQPDAAQGVMTAYYFKDGNLVDVTTGMSVALETSVTFSVAPAEGYEMDHWMINGSREELEAGSPNNKVIDIEGDLEVAPVLKEKVAPQPTEGTITMIQPDATQGVMTAYYFKDGSLVDVTTGMSVALETPVTFSVAPAEEYEMDHWMINGSREELEAGSPNSKVIDIEGDLEVAPVLKEKVAPQPTEATVTMIQPDAVQGVMTAYYFKDGSQIDVTTGMSVAIETSVTFSVAPAEGYEMDHWVINGSREELEVGSPNNKVIDIEGDLEVEPVLKEKVAPQPTEGTITMIQPDATQGVMTAYYFKDGSLVDVTTGMSVALETPVTFSVAPAEGYEMDHWMINGSREELEAGSPNNKVIDVEGDLEVEPVLKEKVAPQPTEATVTLQKEGLGGFVTGKYKEPDAINERSLFADMPQKMKIGTVVKITANITPGYEVTYTNNGTPAPIEALSEDGLVYTFTVEGDVTVQATFAEKDIPAEDFTVTYMAGEGGTLTATADMESFESGAKVTGGKTIKLTAQASEGYEVDEWKLNGKVLTGNAGRDSYIFVLEGDVTVEVTFRSTKPVEYTVTLQPILPSAEAGTVTLFKKNGTPCDFGTAVAEGSEMYIEIKPANKYVLEMLKVNGVTLKPGDDALVNQVGGGYKYSFTLSEAMTFEVTFKLSNAIDNLSLSEVVVYVVNDGTRLEVEGAVEGADVRIFDYTGQLLLYSTAHALDISVLPAGSYIVVVGDYTTRIVK